MHLALNFGSLCPLNSDYWQTRHFHKGNGQGNDQYLVIYLFSGFIYWGTSLGYGKSCIVYMEMKRVWSENFLSQSWGWSWFSAGWGGEGISQIRTISGLHPWSRFSYQCPCQRTLDLEPCCLFLILSPRNFRRSMHSWSSLMRVTRKACKLFSNSDGSLVWRLSNPVLTNNTLAACWCSYWFNWTLSS